MDYVFLIDRIGEPATAAAIGGTLGIVFGALALWTGFCTRSAVLDVTRSERGFTALANWLVALGVAVGGTQLLIMSGTLDVSETRFFSTA